MTARKGPRIVGYRILFSSSTATDDEIEIEIDKLLRNVHDKKIIALVDKVNHDQVIQMMNEMVKTIL